MASLLQDGCYSLHYVIRPGDSLDERFISGWAEALFTEYSSYIDEPFILRLAEYHSDRQEYGWMVDMRSTDPKTELSDLDLTKFLTRTRGRQQYFGRNHEDASENYAGCVEISVVMPERDSCGSDHRPCLAASILMRLAFSHYYEKIERYYLAWTTDYLNAPDVTCHNLGLCKTIDEIW